MTAVWSGFAKQFEPGHIRKIQDGKPVVSLRPEASAPRSG
jgi:hypothetical protein